MRGVAAKGTINIYSQKAQWEFFSRFVRVHSAISAPCTWVIKDLAEENRACFLDTSRVYQLIHCCDP